MAGLGPLLQAGRQFTGGARIGAHVAWDRRDDGIFPAEREHILAHALDITVKLGVLHVRPGRAEVQFIEPGAER